MESVLGDVPKKRERSSGGEGRGRREFLISNNL
jgi:hypothetical protein